MKLCLFTSFAVYYHASLQMSNSYLPRFIIKYFTIGEARTLRARSNIMISFGLKAATILVNLAIVPLTIDYVDSSKYGIWLTLSSIIGWLLFFDIGFGNGLRNKFAESVARGDSKEARIYVSTSYAALTAIVVAIFVFFCGINPFLNWAHILNAPDQMASELSVLALVMFLFFSTQYVLQLITSIVTANQQPAKAALFNFLGGLLSLVLIFGLTRITTSNLLYLGIALGISPVIVLSLSSLWLYTHGYRKYAPAFRLVRLRSAGRLMDLGIQFFVLQIVWIVVFATGNIIIAQLFGPSEVTNYNIAFRYFSVMTMAFNIITGPFWSAFTEAFIRKDIAWIEKSTTFLIRMWLFTSVVTIVMMICSNFIYQIWVGEEIRIPISLSILIGVFTIISNWNSIFVNLINGVGKIRLQMYLAIFIGFVNIPLSIFLGKQIGIEGVVLSSCICLLLGGSLWAPLQHKKLLSGTAAGIWAK